jgi:CBS domain containing-hemolysin-like protein
MGLSRRPIFVPELQPVAAFISALQRAGQQCAVVVDEHGTVVGLAFLEDAVEEIIGPVRDEFDVPENEPVINEVAPGLFEAPGSLPMRTVSRWFHIELDDSADTLGGFLMAKLGTLPSEGDEVMVDEHRFRITSMADRRIATVQIESTAEEPPPSSA